MPGAPPVNGLHNVSCWASAVHAGGGADAAEAVEPLNKFCQVRDRFVMGTVCDGDCGIDVMTQMVEWPRAKGSVLASAWSSASTS